MGIVRQIKNVANGYSPSQIEVRDATANNEQPPPLATMQSIANATYDDVEVVLIMDMLDKRLNDKGKYWRHVLKSLVLLDYLVHFGSDRVIQWCHENLYIIKTLREFNHRDDSGRDVGGAIRARARDLTSLLMNAERLEEERAGRRRKPKRYRKERTRSRRSQNDEDAELQRALELSKETAAREEEMRRMSGKTSSQQDLERAMALNAQNTASLYPSVNYTGGVDPYLLQLQQQQAQLQQLLQQQQTGLAAQQTGMYDPYGAQAQAQAQAEAQAQAQLQAQMQAQAQAQAEAQAEAQAQAQLQAQMDARLQAQSQMQSQNDYDQPELQPLKTGSNNPFAAFNDAQRAQSDSQQSSFGSTNLDSSSTGSKPRLHRQSTFDKEHMDRLDQILSLDAPMDTFGNTGMAKIPAQHTENTGFVDSSGRGLTAMLTARQTGQNNPFVTGNSSNYGSNYNQSGQMQPAHTGFGFGNANSSSSNNSQTGNLIDL